MLNLKMKKILPKSIQTRTYSLDPDVQDLNPIVLNAFYHMFHYLTHKFIFKILIQYKFPNAVSMNGFLAL